MQKLPELKTLEINETNKKNDKVPLIKVNDPNNISLKTLDYNKSMKLSPLIPLRKEKID
jgi:hypothetical protein